MFTCVICSEDKDDSAKNTTPCCHLDVCADCVTESTEALVRYQGDRYVCSLCQVAVADPHDYDAMLPLDTVGAMDSALAALVPVAAAAVTVDDATLRTNAWQFGAYTHSPGCGSAVSVIDGCDTLKCPTCGAQINIAGGQPGTHTFTVEAFFRDVQKFGGHTAENQLGILQSTYPAVWDARFLTELVDGIRAGTLAGWIDSMADYVWGGFLDFLRQRVAPRAQGPDESSLFALIQSVDASSPDGQLLTTHYHQVEASGTMDELPTVQARRRLAGELADTAVGDILRKKFKNNAWWRQ